MGPTSVRLVTRDVRQRPRLSALLFVATLAGLVLAAFSQARSEARWTWRWVTIERTAYTTTQPGPIRIALTTGSLLAFPVSNTSIGWGGKVPNFDARVRLVTLARSGRIGRPIRVDGAVRCTNEGSFATTKRKQFTLRMRVGQRLLLPGSTLQHSDTSCSWSVYVDAPTIGGGAHGVIAQLQAFAPHSGSEPYVLNEFIQDYEGQECTIVVRSGAESRKCRPIYT
jgi:hypothetical protein